MIYKVYVEWTMCKIMEIEADSLEEAIELSDEEPLSDGDYVDGSFEVREDVTEELNNVTD